jgi:predicted TIM-barrel fold metal-dependent hydrolase
MKNGFRIFDTHTHLGTARHSGRSCSADDLLRHMDRHGVDRSVVIPFPVVDDYRREHDLIGRAVRAHPDRLTGAACLYPFIPGADFRTEVRRCREEYGFAALKLQPQYHGLNPLSNSSDFLFEAALENRLAVICHTGTGLPFAAPSLCMMPARKFPDLTIVVAHCGGGIFVHEAILAAVFCPNIVLELSSLMPHHVREVLAHVPSSRLMIGSDLPESIETEIGKILTLETSDDDKRRILWQTACVVFQADRP